MAEAVRNNPHIHFVNLSNSALDDEAMQIFINTALSDKISMLDFSNNNLTDLGVEYMRTALARINQLEETSEFWSVDLNLNFNQIQGVGIDKLVVLPILYTLELCHNHLDDAAVIAMHSALINNNEYAEAEDIYDEEDSLRINVFGNKWIAANTLNSLANSHLVSKDPGYKIKMMDSISQAKIQKNAIELSIPLEYTNATYGSDKTEVSTTTSYITMIATDLPAHVSNITNASISANYAGSKTTEKNTSKNVQQTKGPFVSSGYMPRSLSEGFANAAQNIGNAAGQIARPLLFRQRMTRGVRELSQFITSAGRTGIVNSLQQLVRPRCSLDGSGLFRG